MGRGIVLFGTLFLVFFCSVISAQAQKIDIDSRGNFTYSNSSYCAKLESNNFKELVYTDQNNNSVIYAKDYLELEYEGITMDNELKKKFFETLAKRYEYIKRYKASFTIKGFDRVIIKSNLNPDIEFKRNIRGHKIFKDLNNEFTIKISKDIFDKYNYKSEDTTASVKKKGYLDKWEYVDSIGNTIELTEGTWYNLLCQYGSEEGVLYHLITTHLLK